MQDNIAYRLYALTREKTVYATRMFAIVFAVTCTVGVVGCATRPKPMKLADVVELGLQPVILEVENHNWSDVIVYLLVDGRRHRFMQVTATKDDEKEIPIDKQGTMGHIGFAIHRIGSRDEYRTETVSIRTGRTIRLTLESNLVRSSISVF